MTEPVRVKRGDVGIVFLDVFANAEGTPIPLTDATDILFVMRLRDNVIVGAAEVVDADAGTVSYTTVEGDLDAAGLYRQEWEASFVDGRVLTTPGADWNGVEVVEDLNPPDEVTSS
jgi:hypothetical protein